MADVVGLFNKLNNKRYYRFKEINVCGCGYSASEAFLSLDPTTLLLDCFLQK